jgi:FtsH-binding integral membrane protein
MSMYPNSQTRPVQLEYGTDNKAVFNFFNAVYAWMAVGLAVTAAVGFFVAKSGLVYQLFGIGRFGIIAVALGAWAVAWAAQRAALNMNANLATVLYMLYAVVLGVLLSSIFIVYSNATLVSAFLLTGGVFGAMSVYGFITKRDLTTIGSYLVMAVIGLFIASIVNIFFASDLLSWVITYAVLFVFIGITAYETQALKNLAIDHAHDGRKAASLAIFGSIVLYISFINIFMSILRILGNRR